MGLPSLAETDKTNYCLSPKIYQPSNMEGLLEFPRKKKMFSSSSFYEEPGCLYPTVEEQVQLCRQIAESLSDDCNHKSKGANMFFKRVKKAEKWIVAQSNGTGGANESEPVNPESLSQLPYVRPRKQPKLKLLLDPRHIIDMQRLLSEGVDIVQHDAVSPEVCHNLVRDLNGPSGKGALLFARRKKKSEEWVVDEDKVRHLLGDRYPCRADEDPQVDSVVESVIRAAEAKVMRYPNAVPHVPVIRHLETPAPQEDPLLKYSVPKGWTSTSPEPAKLASAPVSRSMSFANFNASPRAWGAPSAAPVTVRPVRPPSLLLAGAH
ncbi:hypothetical protein JTE90_005219 [Oedothorax gibbosus]|uniref:Uncharacterized protein n=1 Tax=Oedothorax gibbosus TaxID=931172 RepID=A0AAV6UMY0_9ARAC|nr:hypothetical protein JTE90_005219 [Oedothorax gibbosus]